MVYFDKYNCKTIYSIDKFAIISSFNTSEFYRSFGVGDYIYCETMRTWQTDLSKKILLFDFHTRGLVANRKYVDLAIWLGECAESLVWTDSPKWYERFYVPEDNDGIFEVCSRYVPKATQTNDMGC